MRARSIKPSLFSNELLGTADPLATILFAGLWCLADREGKLEDRPSRIKAQILPYRNCDAEQLLNLLASLTDDEGTGLIVRYQVGGKKMIQIPNFLKHQNPHYKEVPSILPNVDSMIGRSSADHKPTLTQPCINVESIKVLHDPLTPPSLFLTPDSGLLTPDSGLLTPDSPSPSLAAKRKRDQPKEGFTTFWKVYPRKVARIKAVEAWNRIQPDHLLQEQIMHALARQVSSADWLREAGRYIPHPARYLNEQRWEDDVRSIGKGEQNGHSARPRSDRTAASFVEPEGGNGQAAKTL